MCGLCRPGFNVHHVDWQLQPLSTQQIEALDENKKLRDRRTTVLKGGLIGIFVTISFTGLYLYRARAA